MPFSRTIDGKVSTFLFLDKPLIWVEGPDDITFYSCNIPGAGYYLKSAGGYEECRKLADELKENDYSYVVIFDGDYSVVEGSPKEHLRIVYLKRYAIENFFFNKGVLEEFLRMYCSKAGDLLDHCYDEIIEMVHDTLLNLVILDYTEYRIRRGRKIFPDHIEVLLENCSEIQFCDREIKNIYDSNSGEFGNEEIEKSREILLNYLKSNSLINIIKGHILFGLITRTLRYIVKRNGKKIQSNNRMFLMILSELVNRLSEDTEYVDFKYDIQQALSSC